MNIDILPKRFSQFCGDYRFRKFVHVLNARAKSKQRLLYWQHDLWTDFTAEHPEYAKMIFRDIQNSFAICHIHLTKLQHDKVNATYGYWKFPEEYNNARQTEFPYANMMYCGDSVELERDSNRNVQYCIDCRVALENWNSDRRTTIGMPESPRNAR